MNFRYKTQFLEFHPSYTGCPEIAPNRNRPVESRNLQIESQNEEIKNLKDEIISMKIEALEMRSQLEMINSKIKGFDFILIVTTPIIPISHKTYP